MKRRRCGIGLRRKPEWLAEKTIELGPIQVEMLKVLLRDIAHKGRIGLGTNRLLHSK